MAALGLLAALAILGRPNHGEDSDREVLASAAAQPAGVAPQPVQRRFEALISPFLQAGRFVEPTEGVQELRVTVQRGSVGPSPAAGARAANAAMSLVSRSTHSGAVPVQRALEVGPSELLIVALDRDGTARWAGTTPDPGIIRAEFPDPSGLLSGQVIERPSVDAVLLVPANPVLTEVRLYRPGADGNGLALIGSVPLG